MGITKKLKGLQRMLLFTMANAAYSCIRRTFCWLNLVLWFCSCAFLGLGFWLRISYHGYATLLPDHEILSADSLFIGVGIVGFVVTFLGCCGAWTQSRCILLLYITMIAILFLSQFLVISATFLFRGGIGRTLANELRFGIEKHYNPNDRGSLVAPSVAAIWDSMQSSFECCGVTTYEDWYDINAWSGKRWVPDSCCKSPQDQRGLLIEGSGDTFGFNYTCGRSQDPALWWNKGCAHKVQSWLTERLNVVGAIGLGIGFAQLFDIIVAMILFFSAHHARDSDTYKSYTPSIDQQTQPRTTAWDD